MQVGMKVTLVKDANLKYDSYGADRPDGKPTQTLKAGTQVEITKIVDSPKPGQTHTVHVNNAGWIEANAFCKPPAKPAVGMKVTLAKDVNLKYDSYGGARPDGVATQTLKAGAQVEITKIVENPKPGQTHPVHINNIGWIPADAIKL